MDKLPAGTTVTPEERGLIRNLDGNEIVRVRIARQGQSNTNIEDEDDWRWVLASLQAVSLVSGVPARFPCN